MDRGRKACVPCRARKTRCSGPVDSDVCVRCHQLHLDCVWLARAKRGPPRHTANPHRSPSTSSATATPVAPEAPVSRFATILHHQVEVRQLVRTYFGTVHYYGYLSFVHEPSYLRLLDQRQEPRNLTAMMIACSLRFAGNGLPATLEKADHVYEEVMRRLLPRMYQRYGAIDLMTTLLTRIFEHARGRFSASWMMVGNCVRMMQYLSLHTFDSSYPENASGPRNPLLQREALRRLAWAVFYLDCMVDAGLYGVHTVDENSFRIALPTNDETFVRGDAEKRDATSQNSGFSSHVIRTMAMRRRILHFLSSAKYSTQSQERLHEELDQIQLRVKALIAELPRELSYTEGNLFVHTERRTAFVLLHVLRHNVYLMLLAARLELLKIEAAAPGYLPSVEQSERIVRCMKQRLKHAVPTAQIIHDALRLDVNCDPYVASLGYTALEILILDPIRLKQLDPSVDVGFAEPVLKQGLEDCLLLLRRLSPIEEGIKNLRVEACRRLMRYGFEYLVNSEDRTAVDSLIPAPSAQDDAEYDFRSFHWHRYEPRLGAPLETQQSPVRAQATNESMLDPGQSAVPSGAASPTHSAATGEEPVAWLTSTVTNPVLSVSDAQDVIDEVSISNPPLAVDRSGEDLREALSQWLEFDADFGPSQVSFPEQNNGQWDALMYGSWSDEVVSFQPGVSDSSIPEVPEVPYWPFDSYE